MSMIHFNYVFFDKESFEEKIPGVSHAALGVKEGGKLEKFKFSEYVMRPSQIFGF